MTANRCTPATGQGLQSTPSCAPANRWTAPNPAEPCSSAPFAQLAIRGHHPQLVPAGQEELPLCCHWGEAPGCRPVPLRIWRLANSRTANGAMFHSVERCSSVHTSDWKQNLWPQRGVPWDFTAALTELVADIVARVPEFRHIRVQQIHLGVTRCRRRAGGLLGRITPLRFPGGVLWRRYGSWQLLLQRYWLRGTELLYLIAFPLPRFLDLPFEEKLITIFHELCHISPRFDGDLHRHPGRYCLHTHSKKAYDRQVALLVRAYMQTKPDEQKWSFLRFCARELLKQHGAIAGEWLPIPRLLRFPCSQLCASPQTLDAMSLPER